MDALGGPPACVPIRHPLWVKAECGVGLTGLAYEEAQQDQQQQRAGLEHGFPAREFQEKNNPIVSDIGNIKSNALPVFIQAFFSTFRLFFLSITVP